MEDVTTEAGRLYDMLTTLFVSYGLDVVSAIVILVAGWIVAGWGRRATMRSLTRVKDIDATLRPVVGNIVRYSILILVLIAVLSQFGIQTTSIIAVLGAAGIAVGLALQGTMSNVAAGIVLLVLRPFRVGDYIDAEGIGGTVDEIGLFATEMRTADGVYQTVPNSQLAGRTIRNYSRFTTRRVDIVVSISYDDDIDKATETLVKLMEGDDRVLREPAAPQVMVTELAESSVNLTMRCWTKAENYWPLLFDFNKHAKQAVEAAGMTIPFPQREVRVREQAAAAGGA